MGLSLKMMNGLKWSKIQEVFVSLNLQGGQFRITRAKEKDQYNDSKQYLSQKGS